MHDVTVEPSLQPLTGEVLNMRPSISGEEARLDMCARGFWGSQFEQTFFDLRVFNHSVLTNRYQRMTAIYRKHEQERCRAYGQRVREIERASFIPLVFAASGESWYHLLQVASKISCTEATPPLKYHYSMASRSPSFALLRLAVLYLRGSRAR